MLAFLLTIAVFVFWFIVGLSAVSLLPSKLTSIQRILTAPAVGITISILSVFAINRAGVPVKDFAHPLVYLFLTLSLFIFIIKRPFIPLRPIIAFILILVTALILAAWPMFKYGFDWLSFSNDDMANYCLGAQRFLNHGYFDLPNANDLLSGRDYSLFYWFMHVSDKMRSGSELMLAFLWGTTGLNAHQIFMPCIMALFLSLICVGGALVSTDKDDPKSAFIAMALLAVSPLTTLGVLYQLIGQAGGLTLLCAAVVFLYRPMTNHSWKQLLQDNFLAALIFSAIFIWYPEVLPFLGLGWFLFVGISALTIAGDKGIIKTFGLPVLFIGFATLIILNNYLLGALETMLWQAHKGMLTTRLDEILFPFFLIPSGIPNFFGLLPIVIQVHEPFMSIAIGLGILLLVWCLICTVKQARNLYPGAIVALVMFVFSSLLFYKNVDFGLYKLAMFLQPFLASVLAVALSKWTFKSERLGYLLVSMIGITAIGTQHVYTIGSTGERNSSGLVEIRGASSQHINRQFDQIMQAYADKQNHYYISDTPNVVIGKFQALYSQGTHIYFDARDIFEVSIGFGGRSVPVAYHDFVMKMRKLKSKQFKLGHIAVGDRTNTFPILTVHQNRKDISWITTPQSSIFNGFHYPDAMKNPYYELIKTPRNHLVFINSELGPHYYLASHRPKIAFYQLEADPLFPGQFISGLGQHLLLMVVGKSPKPRMLMEISATLMKQFSSELPKAAIYGAHKTVMPFVGHGSGRIISEPIEPAEIEGASYFNLDMGRPGMHFTKEGTKSGLMLLYGRDIYLDSRRLTVFGRDISLLTENEYQSLQAPVKLEHFPQDLANKQLEYSGIYEDGWISDQAFFILAPESNSTTLVIKGMVPLIKDPKFGSQLIIGFDGKTITQDLSFGSYEVKIPISSKSGKQRIDLAFTNTQRLPGKDGRITGGKLEFIGFIR